MGFAVALRLFLMLTSCPDVRQDLQRCVPAPSRRPTSRQLRPSFALRAANLESFRRCSGSGICSCGRPLQSRALNKSLPASLGYGSWKHAQEQTASSQENKSEAGGREPVNVERGQRLGAGVVGSGWWFGWAPMLVGSVSVNQR